jgi:alpha-glucuronidase
MALSTQAQTANQAWLKYEKSTDRHISSVCVRSLGSSILQQSAVQELVRSHLGFEAPFNDPSTQTPSPDSCSPAPGAKDDIGDVILGTLAQVRRAYPHLALAGSSGPGAFWLTHVVERDNHKVIVAGQDDQGVLYGAFALIRRLRQGQFIYPVDMHEVPAYPIRWVDEWDNPDGSIERGYAGRSIFFEAGNVRDDLAAVSEYGRLLASIGINGLNVNNVNAAPQLIDFEHIPQLARIAGALRPWGVHLAMSVAIASPQTIGGLQTYDPLDPAVKTWWVETANEIYKEIPDFAGFTVKADSEGQPGPSSFGRTPADAANTLAAALAPHGGVVLYRAFVYNHHLDWHDPKADRARAAYDIFHSLDGKFAPNVIVQTKEGPIDFQVREPVSPLFAGLAHTAQAIEVQITQEYTGQQRHLVYLAPMWKWVLDTDLRAGNQPSPVKEILESKTVQVAEKFDGSRSKCQGSTSQRIEKTTGSGKECQGTTSVVPQGQNKGGALAPAELPSQSSATSPLKTPGSALGGLVGVAGIGRDRWLSSPLALANLYAFGRLAWDPNLSPAAIADEWTKQTISTDPQVVATVQKMLMQSWPAYEDYTGPLGLQTLTDITGSHYGPNIESSERNGWGQWHDADAHGVGKDRTVATGSGYAGQYPPQLAKLYEDPATTPDNLLLFFHHVPYTYKLHDGKTVIQYIYDSHYKGAAQAAQFVKDWQSLQPKIDPALYNDVLARLQYQAGHAIVWRDAVVQYFFKLSGIPDAEGRAGNFPGRLEAEDARLTGYNIIDVHPWEDASRGKAVSCPTASNQDAKSPNAKPPDAKNPDAKTPPARNPDSSPVLYQGTTSVVPLRTQNDSGALAPATGDTCIAQWTWTGAAGNYGIAVQYFDLQEGAAKFTLLVNRQPLSTWAADASLPSTHPNGDNSTRHATAGVTLKTGDTIEVKGIPEADDHAILDYIELTPSAK